MEAKIIQFASDNYCGVHPQIQSIINESMTKVEMPYGNDSYVEQAENEFKKIFGKDTAVFFAGTGTASNVMALKSVLTSIDAVICTDMAHINTNECGAFENLIGAKILPLKNKLGKISVDDIHLLLKNTMPIHCNRPRVISITQTTEIGTVYTCSELKEITSFAHKNNLLVHMDGARLCNAAVSLNQGLREITKDVGIDILSFGATKNGCLMAEAVVFFDPNLARDFLYHQKQSMQMFSKMRFIPAQFVSLLKNDLWKSNAENANRMAFLLADSLKDHREIQIAYPVQSNMVFLTIPIQMRDRILDQYHFYTMEEGSTANMCTIRLVTSFCTKEEDIKRFLENF